MLHDGECVYTLLTNEATDGVRIVAATTSGRGFVKRTGILAVAVVAQINNERRSSCERSLRYFTIYARLSDILCCNVQGRDLNKQYMVLSFAM